MIQILWKLETAASSQGPRKRNPEEPALVSGPFSIHYTELNGTEGWSLTHRETGASVWHPAGVSGVVDPVKQLFLVLKMAELVLDLDWSGAQEELVSRNCDAVKAAIDEAIEWGVENVN